MQLFFLNGNLIIYRDRRGQNPKYKAEMDQVPEVPNTHYIKLKGEQKEAK
jgi:hypothetical protein